jgi:plasmid replication initiation protein
MAKLNRGEEINPRVRINSHEFLIFTNRGTGGKDYKALVEGLERLRGTTISTNIRTGDEEQIDVFGLIDKGTIRRKFGLDGRLLWVDIVLSDWVFNAIKANEVLTLNRDYFRLRKPYERRAYEIARKHCGRQKEWKISLELLCKKMGATSPIKKFRFFIKELARQDHLPDYTVELSESEDQVIFKSRHELRLEDSGQQKPRPQLQTTETYERAKRFIPHGESVYAWEEDWIQFWRESGCPTLKSADAAFIGFCKQRLVRQNEK